MHIAFFSKDGETLKVGLAEVERKALRKAVEDYRDGGPRFLQVQGSDGEDFHLDLNGYVASFYQDDDIVEQKKKRAQTREKIRRLGIDGPN